MNHPNSPDTPPPGVDREASASPVCEPQVFKAVAEGEGEPKPQPPSEAPAPPARLTSTRSAGGLVYDPVVRQVSHGHFQVCGRREVSGAIPWGFWGGLLLAFVAYFVITGAQGFWSVAEVVWAMVALTVGLVLFRFGRRSSRRLDVLCTLDFEREMLVWPTEEPATPGAISSAGGGELVLQFDEITEVVFAMIDYPLSQRKGDVDVHAFTLLVRDGAERLVPVIEATPAKEEAHEIAKMIAAQLRLNISYVGNGF